MRTLVLMTISLTTITFVVASNLLFIFTEERLELLIERLDEEARLITLNQMVHIVKTCELGR